MYNDYIPVIVFIGLAIALLIVPLIIQHLVSPRHDKDNDKLMSYECGEVPEGSAWVKFNIRFYIIKTFSNDIRITNITHSNIIK